MAFVYEVDQAELYVRDYVVDGRTYDFKEEMLSWGVVFDETDLKWILYATNEMCVDYQAVIDLGLKLYPIQESPDEKLLQGQLGK